MLEKPETSGAYTTDSTDLVRRTCLYIMTKLGDFADELVVVGGLVPSLLINVDELPAEADAHVGTLDLDLGLELGVLHEERYRGLSRALRAAGFAPASNPRGQPTRQRWHRRSGASASVDFLIQPSRPGDHAGSLRGIETDFGAIITPGLHLAFRDRIKTQLEGVTLLGESASRSVWVCGPGGFVVLKALAFEIRGENKDAFDLYYVVRNFGSGVADVSDHLRPLLGDASAQRALAALRNDFGSIDDIGPLRAARFIAGGPDDDIQADVFGAVGELLEALE